MVTSKPREGDGDDDVGGEARERMRDRYKHVVRSNVLCIKNLPIFVRKHEKISRFLDFETRWGG